MESIALISQRTTLTRAALARAVGSTAAELRPDLPPGTRVALCGSPTVEYVVLLLALAHLDCEVALVDPRTFLDADAAVRACAAEVLVLPRADRRSPGPGAAWRHPGPAVRVVPAAAVVDLPPGEVDAEDLTPAEPVDLDALESWPWAARPAGLVQFTSGTTGTPSPVLKVPARMLANCRRTCEVLRYRDDDVLAPLLPLDHQYGLSILMIGLLRRLPVVVGPPDRVLETLRLALRHGATVIDTTPSVHGVLMRSLRSGRLRPTAFDGVRYLCVGGAPTTPALRAEAGEVHGRALLDGYGSTELGNVAHALPGDGSRLRALPGIELRVVDPSGSPVTPGAWGRLQVRTPDAPPVDAWQSTGDLARLPGQGLVEVAGRADAISRRGAVVYPASIEHGLHRGGVHAVCVPAPDRRKQDERLIVVVEAPCRRRAEDWRLRVESVLSAAERPDRIVTLPHLPVHASSGKIDRALVARWARALDARTRDDVPLPDGLAGPEPELLRRRAALHRVRSWIDGHRAELMAVLVRNCTEVAAREEIDAALGALDEALADVVLHRPPWVPASWIHMPSNVVLYSYALYALVPSLYTDHVVLRPSSRARAVTVALHRLLQPVHRLDVDLFDGTQAEFRDLRAGAIGTVVFTGRFENAERVRESLDDGHVMVFFGQGANPMVIGPDADIARAARDCVGMRLMNAGQDCFGPDFLLVHDSVRRRFTEHVLDLLASSGPGTRPAADEGVLVAAVRHIGRARHRVVHGGQIDLRTSVLEPTVLGWDVTDGAQFDEMFAPIFNLVGYQDDAQVVRMLDRPHDRERAMCVSLYGVADPLVAWCAERMTVCLDATVVETDQPGLPFGGAGVRANYVATRRSVRVGQVLVSQAAASHADILAPTPAVGVGADEGENR